MIHVSWETVDNFTGQQATFLDSRGWDRFTQGPRAPEWFFDHIPVSVSRLRSIEVNLPDSLSDVFTISLNSFGFLWMYNQVN